jgi:hypothetical protein
LTAVHSTDSEEIDEIKNERIEKEVEDILEKSIVSSSALSFSSRVFAQTRKLVE